MLAESSGSPKTTMDVGGDTKVYRYSIVSSIDKPKERDR
jgi:hypothetical protein